MDKDINYLNDEEILPIERTKEEFTYHYYFEYYPVKFNVSDEFNDIRKFIWNFKDGHYGQELGEDISPDIHCLNLNQPTSNWWLCVIPASTHAKTINRFKNFCAGFCKNTEINNGFDLIRNSNDREAIHVQENRGAINILDSIEFGNVSDKNILLFDDLYTSGKSFLKVARRLKVLGAEEVRGLFLGKTHWIED